MIVVVLPSGQNGQCVVQRHELIDVQTLVAQTAGERFAQPVFHRLPGPDEVELDIASPCPVIQGARHELRPMIDGETMAVVCRYFDISRNTGCKIVQRYKDCGLDGLTDSSR